LLGTYVWKQTMDRAWSSGALEKTVSHYIAPSQTVARKHLQMGLPKQKLSLIANFSPDPAPATITPGHGAVFVGRLVPEKGVDTLIEAWKRLQANPVLKGEVLTLVGEGPARAQLERLAAADPSIRFAGKLQPDGVQQALRAAAVAVVPSRWEEPFGLGVIEAMALGRPVIATQLGGPAEIVTAGHSGWLVPPDAPEALANALEEALTQPQKTFQLGQAAREDYLAHYHPDQHLNSLLRLYRQLAG
jgi:glycosyltransferase involved in cell wall biosynthesis